MSPELAAGLSALLTAALGGAGWLVRRKLTKEPAKERTALYMSLAELSLKLREAGLSLDDARKLETGLFAEGSTPSRETLHVVAGEREGDEEGNLPSSYFTSARMQVRAMARLASVDNQLEELVVGFEGLICEEHAARVREAYEYWGEWRTKEAEAAAFPFIGGSLHGLLLTLALIKLGETYAERLAGELKGAKELAGSNTGLRRIEVP